MKKQTTAEKVLWIIGVVLFVVALIFVLWMGYELVTVVLV